MLHKFIFKKQSARNTEMPEKRTEATQKHNRKDRQKTKERIQNDPELTPILSQLDPKLNITPKEP